MKISGLILLLAALVVAAGCGTSIPEVSPAPIPVGQGPGQGGLYALGAFGSNTPGPLLIDTGTVLTTHSVTSTQDARMLYTDLQLLDITKDSQPPVPRVVFKDVRILETRLGAMGINGQDLDLTMGGILGGDLLRQFSLDLHYGGSPTIAFLPGEITCSCALADACQVVLPFTLAGGGTMSVGSTVLDYPATRVTVDACLEPVTDPVKLGVGCVDQQGVLACGYTQDGAPGVNVRFLVATGFPGILLGASAYDRMCTQRERFNAACPLIPGQPQWHAGFCQKPTAQQLLAETTLVEVRYPGLDTPIMGAPITLGDAQAVAPLASMVLVSHENLLSACAELARSRRLHASPPDPADCNRDYRPNTPGSCLQVITGNNCSNPDRCNDRNQPAAGLLELDAPLTVYVIPDTAPVLQEVNFDVRPTLADVEGVIGSELLSYLEARIDYPNRRVIAHCGCQPGCTAYPRYACPDRSSQVGDCGDEAGSLCNPPASIIGDGPLCLPAPIDTVTDRDAGVPLPNQCGDGGY